MSNDPISTGTTEFLDRLYWTSNRTVDEIADSAGVSRNTLYRSIQPLMTGITCDECAAPMVFTNRTRRVAGVATCIECQLEVTLAEASTSSLSDETGELASGGREGGANLLERLAEIRSARRERAAKMGSFAAVGMMIGAAATRAARH